MPGDRSAGATGASKLSISPLLRRVFGPRSGLLLQPSDDWAIGIDPIAKIAMNAMHHILAQPRAMWLLAILPVLGILALLAERRRRWSLLQLSGMAGLRHM